MSPTDPTLDLSTAHDTLSYPHWCAECRRMVAASNRWDEASAAQDHYRQKLQEREGVTNDGHVQD